ncbi:MAG: DUF45 domain-containing protein [Spirochaetales bacterium]|nr:DUF45 domain-containing protein [Spirochaetales bacterium]
MEYGGHKIWQTQIVWGKNRGVIFIPNQTQLCILRDDTLILTMPAETTPKQRKTFLQQSLKNILADEIHILMPKWETITGLKCSEWFIGKGHTAWDWCRPTTGKIMLNEGLIYKPKICLEYVILHELCHLQEGNHGKRFAALLNQYMPNWRECEILDNGVLPRYAKY